MFISICIDGLKVHFKDCELKIAHNTYGKTYAFDLCIGYYINNSLHNELGPAIIWRDGNKSYYLNDKKYSYEEWLKQINKKDK